MMNIEDNNNKIISQTNIMDRKKIAREIRELKSTAGIKWDHLEYCKAGFPSVKSFKDFIKNNGIRKSKDETYREFIEKVRKERIEKKNKRIENSRKYPMHGPHLPRGNPRHFLRPHTYTKSVTYSEIKDIRYDKPIIKKINKYDVTNKPYLGEKYYIEFENIPIDSSNLYQIADYYIECFHNLKNKLSFNSKVGWGKLWFCWESFTPNIDMEEKIKEKIIISSKTLRFSSYEIPSRKEVILSMQKCLDSSSEGENYQIYLSAYDYLFKLEPDISFDGGCTTSRYQAHTIQFTKDVTINLHCDKGINNNCLFACLKTYYDTTLNGLSVEICRKDLNLGNGTKIRCEDIHLIVKYYNTKFNKNLGFVLFNEEYSLSSHYNVPPKDINITSDINKNIIPLFIYKDHYYTYNIISKIPCEICGKKIVSNNMDKHMCSLSVACFNNNVMHGYIAKFIEYFDNKYGPYNKICNWIKNENKWDIDMSKVDEEDRQHITMFKLTNKFVTKPSNIVNISNSKKRKQKETISIFFDFEAFKDDKQFNKQVTYAIGLYCEFEDKYNVVYCDDERIKLYGDVAGWFYNYVKNYCDKHSDKNIKLIAFNGSRYDFHILLEKFMENDEIIDFTLNNGRIINFKFKNMNVFDLALFLPGYSLKKACEDFEVSKDNSKGEFKHELIKSFEDAISYKGEIYPYLEKDVKGLYELFMIIRKLVMDVSINTKAGKNRNETEYFEILDYITLSHCGFDIWRYLNKNVIQIPSYDVYKKYIAPSCFGGRTNPFQYIFKSKHLENVENLYNICLEKYHDKIIHYKELLKDDNVTKEDKKIIQKKLMNECFGELKELYGNIKNSFTDYIVNCDVTSLYPAAMSGFLEGKELYISSKNGKFKYLVNKPEYPCGILKEISINDNDSDKDIDDKQIECMKMFKEGHLGIYKISYVVPKHITYPVLPKGEYIGNCNRKVGVDWSLSDNEGYYTSIDIENARCAGYKISFLGDCVYWTRKANVFSEYINKFIVMKNEADKIGNEALRSICKLFMNSLFGKTLQAPIISETMVINNLIEFDAFIKTHHLDEFTFSNGKLIVTGDVIDADHKMVKPSQLGTFILAYSRRIMLYYMMLLDPSLRNINKMITYMDTDSAHIKCEYLHIWKDAGLYVDKKNAQLGLFTSDIKNEGIILSEINLGPKSYMYEYLDSEGLFDDTKKSKGIPKKLIKKEFYVDASKEEYYNIGGKQNIAKFETFTKLLYKPNNFQLPMFSIKIDETCRKFNSKRWVKWVLIDNVFYPMHHEILNDPFKWECQ